MIRRPERSVAQLTATCVSTEISEVRRARELRTECAGRRGSRRDTPTTPATATSVQTTQAMTRLGAVVLNLFVHPATDRILPPTPAPETFSTPGRTLGHPICTLHAQKPVKIISFDALFKRHSTRHSTAAPMTSASAVTITASRRLVSASCWR